MDLSTAKLTGYIIPAAFIVLFLALRLRRMGQMRPLKVDRLWVIPTIYLIALVLSVRDKPPALAAIPWLVAAVVAGAAIGWYRGKSMRIVVDPQTHAINQVASPLTLVFLVALIGLKYGISYLLRDQANHWSFLADLPLFLGCATFITTRLEMYIRAQTLLRQARGF